MKHCDVGRVVGLWALLLVAVCSFAPGPGLSLSVSCTAQYQCGAVSSNYNYVACVEGNCQCLNANGFSGSAAPNDKCRCDAPRSVYWKDSSPYCISYSTCAASEVAADRTAILKSKVKQVYDNLIYPTAAEIVAGQVSVADLFSPNAKGRIDPVGTFDTYTTLVEYYYVIASVPGSRVTSIDYIDLFGVGNEVFVRANVLFEQVPASPNGYGRKNITQSGRYLFDDNNLILSVDAIIHNIGMASNPPAAAQSTFIAQLCTVLTVNPATCPPALDPSGYYSDYDDCVSFLSGVPFGTFDQAFSDTVICRSIHTKLTVADPVVHCPHAGKTGGGKCVDVPYESYYLVNY